MNELDAPAPADPDPQPPAGAAPPDEAPPPGGGEGLLRWNRWIKRLLVVCIAFELLWVVLDQCISELEWIDDGSIQKIFKLTLEENAPTWFSSGQASLAGLTLLAIYFVVRAKGAAKWTCRGWLAVGFCFLYIGLDDAAKIHERVGSAIGRWLETDPDSQIAPVRLLLSIDTYSWQRFLMPVFAAVGIFVVVFLWRHLGAYRLRKFLVAGMACFTVAVAIDFVEGIEEFFEDLALQVGLSEDFVSHTLKVVEEILEMFGTTMFWQGFLRYLARESDGFTLRMRAA